MGYLFGCLDSVVMAVFPLNSLCTPRLLASMAVGETERTLALCKPSSEITKRSHCQSCFQHKSKTQPTASTMKKINSIQAKTSILFTPSSILYGTIFSMQSWGRKKEVGTYSVMVFFFPRLCYVWWSPASLMIVEHLSVSGRQWINSSSCFACKSCFCHPY